MLSFSGGLIYHLRALRYSKSAWGAHRKWVRSFLEAWNPQAKTLVLVGSSGGYALAAEFLNRFEKIIAYEPDRVARKIFEKRFSIGKERSIEWRGAFAFKKTEELPADAAILFCNLLGQIPLKNPAEFRRRFLEIVGTREWASYHDAYSGENVDFYHDPSALQADRRKAKASDIRQSIRARVQTQLRVKTLVVNEHPAFELFGASPDYRFFYWQWNLTPQRAHFIEGLYSIKRNF